MVVVLGGYIAYLYAAYYRLPDNLKLRPQHNQAGAVQVGKTYRAQSYNIGYDSYPPSYSFFMDGGKYSRAYSKKAVQDSLAGVIKTTRQGDPDFAFFFRKWIRTVTARSTSTKWRVCAAHLVSSTAVFTGKTTTRRTSFTHLTSQSVPPSPGW